ncbi:MAG TPA: IclR family transcriptional regulator [Candidatus Eremiobacteraceae bacterium]|jgi:DNA-binding IclR family transcriptional regulator
MFTLENGRRTRANASVPAVLKAFRLLDILSESQEPLGVSELARRLEMGKSTVYGLVTTLHDVGAIEAADGAKRYRIGRGLTALAMRSVARQDVRSAARPHLERLAAETEQTTFLGLVGTDSVTILDLVHGRPAMAVSAPVGSSIPLLAGAVGKAVLAAWEPRRRARFIAHTELPRFTPQSVTDRSAYTRAVDETERRGVALDVDEYVDGMRAAAAAVVAQDGRLAAVVWVAGFARHIDDANLERIADAVAREARAIARSL